VSEGSEFLVRAVVIGAGATAVMDIWAALLQRLSRTPPSDWAMVGRWIGHLPSGRLVHDNIAQAPPIRGELVLGWTAHYVIGVIYAALVIAIWGIEWARRPTLLPALIFSLIALVAPFFLLQPGMGMGIAGSRTSRPHITRLRSALNHIVFGFGLYASAWLYAQAVTR
jgi:hypothetical protein